jgi:hypothetical protein
MNVKKLVFTLVFVAALQVPALSFGYQTCATLEQQCIGMGGSPDRHPNECTGNGTVSYCWFTCTINPQRTWSDICQHY